MRAAFKGTTGSRIVVILLALAAAWGPNVRSQEPANETEIRTEMTAAERLLGKTPDRASVLYLLAALHAQLGEIQQAMANLKECVSLKAGFGRSGVRGFEGRPRVRSAGGTSS
jgi:hypothetical protein